MPYEIKKRNFLRGIRDVKTTLTITKRMSDALDYIADQTGATKPMVICEALEQYLTHLMKNGAIPSPPDDEKDD